MTSNSQAIIQDPICGFPRHSLDIAPFPGEDIGKRELPGGSP